MLKQCAAMGMVVLLSAGLSACDVEKTREGNISLPEFKQTKEGDVTLPKVDIDAPEVAVTQKERTVEVPTVKTEKKTVEVPSIDVKPAKENDADTK